MKPISALLLAALCWLCCYCTNPRLAALGQRTQFQGELVRHIMLDCFEAGLQYDTNTPVYCEASAVVRMGDQLLIAIDKPVPGEMRSPVFSIPIKSLKNSLITNDNIRYINAAPFLEMQKIEAMTTAGDTLFFATTAFDRIKSSTEWDSYNTLAHWQTSGVANVKYTTPGALHNARILRNAFRQALRSDTFPEGPPYFKIEALTVLPDSRLIFGVREIGKSYLDFHYTCTLVEARYVLTPENEVILQPNFKKVYEYQPFIHDNPLGISDLIYQPTQARFMVLTSLEGAGDERSKDLRSYLWVLPIAHLDTGAPPIPIQTKDGQPLELPHKGEGLLALDARTLLIVHDEDRKDSRVQIGKTQWTKQPHQTILSIVRIR
jgi:hypothetical protein